MDGCGAFGFGPNALVQGSSPGLDREWNDSPSFFDLDRLPRNVDLLWVPDVGTPRDFGCFERQM